MATLKLTTITREDAGSNGGKIVLNRAVDDAAYWTIASVGSTTTPTFDINASATTILSLSTANISVNVDTITQSGSSATVSFLQRTASQANGFRINTTPTSVDANRKMILQEYNGTAYVDVLKLHSRQAGRVSAITTQFEAQRGLRASRILELTPSTVTTAGAAETLTGHNPQNLSIKNVRDDASTDNTQTVGIIGVNTNVTEGSDSITFQSQDISQHWIRFKTSEVAASDDLTVGMKLFSSTKPTLFQYDDGTEIVLSERAAALQVKYRVPTGILDQDYLYTDVYVEKDKIILGKVRSEVGFADFETIAGKAAARDKQAHVEYDLDADIIKRNAAMEVISAYRFSVAHNAQGAEDDTDIGGLNMSANSAAIFRDRLNVIDSIEYIDATRFRVHTKFQIDPADDIILSTKNLRDLGGYDVQLRIRDQMPGVLIARISNSPGNLANVQVNDYARDPDGNVWVVTAAPVGPVGLNSYDITLMPVSGGPSLLANSLNKVISFYVGNSDTLRATGQWDGQGANIIQAYDPSFVVQLDNVAEVSYVSFLYIPDDAGYQRPISLKP